MLLRASSAVRRIVRVVANFIDAYLELHGKRQQRLIYKGYSEKTARSDN